MLDTNSAAYGRAHRALDRARQTGRLVACEHAWAEVSARFSSPDAFAKEIDVVGVESDGPTCVGKRRQQRNRVPRVVRIVKEQVRHVDRLCCAPSLGSRDDAYDNAVAELVIGRYKTEVIRRRGPGRSLEAVAFP